MDVKQRLYMVLAACLCGCAAPKQGSDSRASAPVAHEDQLIAIARSAVEVGRVSDEIWYHGDYLTYEVFREPNGWTVVATRPPATPGGHTTVVMNLQGEVLKILPGL